MAFPNREAEHAAESCIQVPDEAIWPDGPEDDTPLQCYRCGGIIQEGEETEVVLVDLDPGDPEVGPDPDVQEVKRHKNCYEVPA